MPRPPELSPRKTPRQQRSKDMLERIIEAGTRVLSEHGYDGASTNRIADLARLYLRAHRDQFRADLDIEAAVWIMVEMPSQLAIRYLVQPPPIPRDQMINELADMLIGHLTRPAPG